MTSQKNPTSEDTKQGKRPFNPLLAWPMALLAVALGMLLVANTVSAWGSREADRLEDFKEHAEFAVGRMLKKVDAKEEQQGQIQQIVDATINDLAAFHGDRGDLRDEISALMSAQTIDREAIETMRATQLARADLMSRIVSEGLADVMDVLSVDQRVELKERLGKRHGRHGRGWH